MFQIQTAQGLSSVEDTHPDLGDSDPAKQGHSEKLAAERTGNRIRQASLGCALGKALNDLITGAPVQICGRDLGPAPSQVHARQPVQRGAAVTDHPPLPRALTKGADQPILIERTKYVMGLASRDSGLLGKTSAACDGCSGR